MSTSEDEVRIPRDTQPTTFDRIAEASTRFVSHGVFFTICGALVLIWIPTLALFHSVDTWQLVINTFTSVLAFLLIALLQNSERRYDEALHRKIDVIAAALADLIEHGQEGDPELRSRYVEELRRAVRLEEDVST